MPWHGGLLALIWWRNEVRFGVVILADAPKQSDAAPDADTRRCDPAKPFAAPVRLAELSSPLNDNSATYFISTRTGKEEIHRAARNVGGTFDAPTTPLILTASSEIAVAVTPDELTMYFSSDMTPTVGLVDIWMSKRSTTADGWGTPTHLADLSTDQVDFVSAVSADGCNVYLSHYESAANSQEIYWARKPL
jgi:hypothetical protein